MMLKVVAIVADVGSGGQSQWCWKFSLYFIIIITIILILLKQDYKIQLAHNKTQMAWLTSWLVVGQYLNQAHSVA